MLDASDALGRTLGEYYGREPESIEPGDDHLRPWKKEAFESLVAVLAELRATADLPSDVRVWVTSHDPSDAMADWIREGVEQLNAPEVYEGWSGAWKAWYG